MSSNRLNDFTGKIDDSPRLTKNQPVQEKFQTFSQKKNPEELSAAPQSSGAGGMASPAGGAQLGFTNVERKRPHRAHQQDNRTMRRRSPCRKTWRRGRRHSSEDAAQGIQTAFACWPRRTGKKLELESEFSFLGAQTHQREIIQGYMMPSNAKLDLIEANLRLVVVHCEEIHHSRTTISRPESGRQPRTDEGRGTKFETAADIVLSTYATWWIRQAILVQLPIRRVLFVFPVHMIEHNKLIRTAPAAGAGTGTRTDGRKKSRQADGHSGRTIRKS